MAGIGSISAERAAKAGAELVREGVRALALKAGFSEAGVVELPYDGDAADAARRVLAQTTIADVLEREMRDAGASMYHI